MAVALVTGADGFIGSHLCSELLDRGQEVRALVLYNSMGSWGWLEPRAGLEVISGDIRDPHAMEDLVAGVDQVYHLAALVSIPYSYHSPEAFVSTNVFGTLNLLQAARKARVRRFVHTSSSEVYGSARYVPIDEQHPLQGQSPYSASKIAADQMALAFYSSFSLPVTVIRPFNTYGPRQSRRAIIPTIVSQISQGSRRIQLGSTSPTRDFSYVSDTVAGILSAAECDDVLGQVCNLGNGFEISIGDLVHTIAAIMQVKVDIDCDGKRVRPENSEVERLLSDNRKAQRVLGWQPEYQGLEGFKRGLEKTIEWLSSSEAGRHDSYTEYQI